MEHAIKAAEGQLNDLQEISNRLLGYQRKLVRV
jgi:hypothetical protein